MSAEDEDREAIGAVYIQYIEYIRKYLFIGA